MSNEFAEMCNRAGIHPLSVRSAEMKAISDCQPRSIESGFRERSNVPLVIFPVFEEVPKPSPKPVTGPVVIIRNVLGQEIDRVEGTRDLFYQDLRCRNWPSVDLSGLSLQGSDLSGANLIGCRCVRTSFFRTKLTAADLSYGTVEAANLREADLRATQMYRTEIVRADFSGSKISAESDIPDWLALVKRKRGRR